MIHHAESGGSKRGLICVLGLTALLLAGCNTPGQPESVAAGMTGGEAEIAAIAAPQTPDTTCGRAIDDFAGLLSRDLANGMVAQRVHDEAMSDLEVAASACRAGSQDQALSALRATRIRHGYPAG